MSEYQIRISTGAEIGDPGALSVYVTCDGGTIWQDDETWPEYVPLPVASRARAMSVVPEAVWTPLSYDEQEHTVDRYGGYAIYQATV